MRTLEELYGSAEQVTDNLPFNVVAFRAAYPTDTEKKAEALRRRSEELILPVIERWRVRLAIALSDAYESGKHPNEIQSIVPWITKDEALELMRAIDEFMPGDTDEIGALRIMEMNTFMQQYMQTATELAQDFFYQYQARKSSIITSAMGPTHKPGSLILP